MLRMDLPHPWGTSTRRRMAASTVLKARLFGVLGDPVEHSLSPAMHNAAFAALRLPHVYLRYRVPPGALRAALQEACTLHMGGVNLTVPLKEAVLPFLDVLTPEAERIGAVNTVVFRPDGTLVGDNTDGRGFLRSLGRRALRGAHAVLVGAGGSARAVGTALVAAGCARITVANRTPARAGAVAEHLAGLGLPSVDVRPLDALEARQVLEDARLVVNTTSTGLHGTGLRVRHALAPRDCLFVDLVYGATPSPWIAAARRAGRPALDGAGMLLHQGALALEAWLGRRAPLAAMASALRAAGLALPRPAGASTAGRP